MTYSQLFAAFREAGLSPEKGAQLMGLSGMTLRRWESRPGKEQLPRVYELAAEEAVHTLIMDGRLPPQSPSVQAVISSRGSLPFQATLRSLGFSEAILKEGGHDPETLVKGLSEIGSDEFRRKEVERNKKKIFSLAKLSAEWKRRIVGLWAVLRSDELTTLDKMVAYGALFYIISPFNLIPNFIPVIGLLDDYAILGLAAAYYMKRFPRLFSGGADVQKEGKE
jgi:uncharacterized membrane protein YkvA (DUF1232 family)